MDVAGFQRRLARRDCERRETIDDALLECSQFLCHGAAARHPTAQIDVRADADALPREKSR